MNKAQALNDFWNRFGLTAYDESTVPDDAALPYITYNFAEDEFGYSISLNASLWYRGRRWDEITTKFNEISNYIGRGGIMVSYEGGAMLIRKGTPFAQRMKDEDDSIRRIYMNIEVEYLS